MAITLFELVERVSPDTETTVDKARQRFNKAVRQILRAETRLQLSSVVTSHAGEERDIRAVRVFVTAGMPERLEPMAFDDTMWLAIELAPLRGDLETPIER